MKARRLMIVAVALSLLALIPGSPATAQELLGHWPFDGDLLDAEGAHDGAFFGGAEPAFAFGYDGTASGALLFDGVDDYVEIADPATELAISDRFTLALWFKAASTDQSQKYLLSRNAPGAQYAIIYEYTDDRVDFFAPSRLFGDDPRAGGMSEMPLEDTDWHHIAYTYDGFEWSGYIDGEQLFTVEIEFALDNTFQSSWWVGAANPTVNHVAGLIDDVRIYADALDEDEIAELYQEPMEVECPEEGDTRCEDLQVEGPPGDTAGDYTITASGTDDSGDPLLFTFRAESEAGTVITVGPQSERAAVLSLAAGTWTVSVRVDDDPFCDDELPEAECSTVVVEVEEAPPRLVARWALDGDLADSEGSNDGTFFGDTEPFFVEGQDGLDEGAISLDGVDDYVEIMDAPELRLRDRFTLALWFQSASTDQSEKYLFSRNDSIPGGSGEQYAIIFEYTDDRVDFFAPSRLSGDDPRAGGRSEMPIEDTDWHHIAYTYDGVTWSGYIDGVQVFSGEITFVLDDTFASSWWIGAANPNVNHVAGAIDDVRIYNYALDSAAIAELASGAPTGVGPFLRGDCNDDGGVNISDATCALSRLFGGGGPAACVAANDVNGDAMFNISDPVALLNYLFGAGSPPPLPFPDCGRSSEENDVELGCETPPASC